MGRIDTRLFFRIKLLFRHPKRVIKHLIFRHEDYSRIRLSEFQRHLVSPHVIIEAGAADGIDTDFFLKYFPSASIFAVEPVNEQFRYLNEKFTDQENLKLFNFAFSERNGESELIIGSSAGQFGGMGSSSILEPLEHEKYFPLITFGRRQQVVTKKLDTFLNENNLQLVDLLWLDILGKELDVLKASRSALVEKVKLLHIEISRISLYLGMPKEQEIRKFLKDHGFICVVDRVGAISGNALYLNTRYAK